MGFFKDFKEDLSEAVNELMPGTADEKEEQEMTNTMEDEVDVTKELDKLDGLLEEVSAKVEKGEDVTVAKEQPASPQLSSIFDTTKEGKKMDETLVQPTVAATISDENAVITAGMSIKGDVTSTGSIEIQGSIDGNVTCNGKLTVAGVVHGNSNSAEFFADSAKIEGEVVTSGTAKVGLGSVIIGNITAASAVIAGAVKGDIDVQGPVVVDTSAVIMGNIKSRSVQINNGAVIEGFCSQSYADIDVNSVFGK